MLQAEIADAERSGLRSAFYLTGVQAMDFLELVGKGVGTHTCEDATPVQNAAALQFLLDEILFGVYPNHLSRCLLTSGRFIPELRRGSICHMEKMKLFALFWGLIAIGGLLSACATDAPEGVSKEGFNRDLLVLSAEFFTASPQSCHPTDLELDKAEVARFFQLATITTLEDLNANYDFAPCHLSGELQRDEKACTWKIQASAIGEMVCEGDVGYFACESASCKQLFE